MFTSDLLLGFQLWFITFIFGLIALPLNRGYFLGKLISLFVISYAAFTLATLKILPLELNSLVFLTVIWAVINAVILIKTKKFEINWKQIILEEAIFLACYLLFIYIKGHGPEIYQIERFMDFGFIKALTQGQWLPLEDIWRSGQPLNYYYFGHFLAYVLITLSKLPIVAGFFLVQCWLFATVGVLAFVVGRSLTKSFFAGLLSLFATIFAGDWQTVFKFQISNFKFEPFWYPDPTRIIPGTISEIPIYSFIVADLHAHVWGFLLGAVIISVLASTVIKKNIILLSFLLGLSIMTNTWDFLTLGSVVFFVLLSKINQTNPIRQLSLIFLCFTGALIFALPWLFYFKFPLGGIGIVTKWSPLKEWFLFWGPSVFLILLFFVSKIKHKINFEKENLIFVLLALSAFWLIFLEIFYAKDILNGGEWYRANTYFKVSLQILLWIGLMTGPAVYLIVSKTKSWQRYLISAVFVVWILSRAVYPIKALYQANLENKPYTGISSGTDFFKTRFPNDYSAYQFLASLEKGVVLEADGDSYQDTSFFSTFLGWPTVTGWAVHEWTWHGDYAEVGKRSGEVREVYTGVDLKKSQDILKKYKVKYIVIASTEHRKYANSLNIKKLESLGKTIYQNGQTVIIKSP